MPGPCPFSSRRAFWDRWLRGGKNPPGRIVKSTKCSHKLSTAMIQHQRHTLCTIWVSDSLHLWRDAWAPEMLSRCDFRRPVPVEICQGQPSAPKDRPGSHLDPMCYSGPSTLVQFALRGVTPPPRNGRPCAQILNTNNYQLHATVRTLFIAW